MLKISQRIRHYRQKKGLTQEAVATALGVRKENYAKYESGERNPKDDRLVEIAKILGVSYNALTEGVEREFVDLVYRHAVTAAMGKIESFYAFYSDVMAGAVFQDISECFLLWEEKFGVEAKPFYEKFLLAPSLKSLIELNDLHKAYIDALIKQEPVPGPEVELEADPELEDEAIYRLAFCIAMTKYLLANEFDEILEEADATMDGADVSPLQFFAVRVFVPFLSHINETVEMTMWNSTIDDFETHFLHGSLTYFGEEEFDDNSDDGEQPAE